MECYVQFMRDPFFVKLGPRGKGHYPPAVFFMREMDKMVFLGDIIIKLS